MKKRIFTALCFVLMASMLLVSCSSPKGESVMTYKNVSIDENTFFYMLAMRKSEVLREYSGSTTDIPVLWAQNIGEGVTFDKYTYLECQLNMKMKLFFANHAVENGGELTSAEKKQIITQVDSIIEEFGSKAALNKYLETYMMNYDMLLDYYELESLYNKGLSMAFSQGGEFEIPAEDAYTYYKNNYVTVKHIAIGTEFAGTDEDGNYIYFTEEEKEARKQLISTILEGLEKGDDWEDYAALSDDKFAEVNPDGYTITRGVLDSSMSGYESVAFSLEEGEWDTFELEGTSTYIIKRVPLLESDFQNCYATVMKSLLEVGALQATLDHDADFVVNQDIIDTYNMAMIPPIK